MINRRSFVRQAGAAAAAVSSGLLQAGEPLAASRDRQAGPNILFITMDQARYDTLGAAGNTLARTPNLDRLAAGGVLFTNCASQSPVCMPSRATMMTGLYPKGHGVTDNFVCTLSPQHATVQELLHRAGYHAAIIGKNHYTYRPDRSGGTKPGNVLQELPAGWDYYDMVDLKAGAISTTPDAYRRELKRLGLFEKYLNWYRRGGLGPTDRIAINPWVLPAELHPDNVVGRKTVEYLGRLPADRPFFLWASFNGPHPPFDTPEPWDRLFDAADVPLPAWREDEFGNKPPEHRHLHDSQSGFWEAHTPGERDRLLRRMTALYWGSVSLIDHWIGKALEALKDKGLSGNTLVVFASDHGDYQGNHRMLNKGCALYDDLVHVPLILSGPGIPAGRNDHRLVELADIFPTLLAAGGAGRQPNTTGHDLVSLARTGQEVREACFSEYTYLKSVRTRRWKYVHYAGKPYAELYDLQNDPHELVNLAGDPGHAARVGEMKELLILRNFESEIWPVKNPTETWQDELDPLGRPWSGG
ncbi:MAG: sulfatase-like hydrolase/transferase [Candidatus Glassbacteria bacterium]|nr:sulfatase-like hydrolase/transferase [Candidatus Glassbacteria bacterium]